MKLGNFKTQDFTWTLPPVYAIYITESTPYPGPTRGCCAPKAKSKPFLYGCIQRDCHKRRRVVLADNLLITLN
jgi:hypothetical protein